jgi:hypothetical protein
LIPFYYAVRKHLCRVPWLEVAWRPGLAAAVMGVVAWRLQGIHPLGLVAGAGGVYVLVLTLVGGFRQPDMGLVWRLIPLDGLRARRWPGRLRRRPGESPPRR